MEVIVVVVSILTLVITGGGLWIAIKQFNQQLRLNFFAEYTKRYQEIILNFPEKINELTFKISELSPEIQDHTLRYMRAYFDLCSEQYYLWRKGHLDEDVWEEWESGIKFALSKPAFQEAWRTLDVDTIYYGDFSKFVSELIKRDT